MEPSSSVQSFEFKAEIQQLLNILVHSLYTDREIFLRELISNASDAINRFQFEMLTKQADEVYDSDAELAIRITADEDTQSLVISDSGIGMTKEEMIKNLGTIAHSGAATFLKALQEDKAKGSDIIGQFGVGFYSVFMVADRVEVISRSYLPDAEAVRWVSTGADSYEITSSDKATRGTEIIVHLKVDDKEFAQKWRLESIIKKHSAYVSFPVYVEDKQVNEQKALWRQSPRKVEDEEYQEFYKQLTFDHEPPLAKVHVSSEFPVDLHAILYIPANRERTLMRMQQQQEGVKLYSRKVLIQESAKDLLPNYFRFVEGVVDSEDLPLNISRETVQNNRVMRQLQRSLVGKLHKEIERLADEDEEAYNKFWNAFGAFIKEGAATEFSERERLSKLLRYHSTETDDDGFVSLTVYKERMKSDQDAIYYVLGDDLRSTRHSPHLDPFRARNLEVLLMVDPIDSFATSSLREFDGTPLRNADDPNLELPPLSEEEEKAQEDAAAPEAEFSGFVSRVKEVLGARIEDVVESKRLTGSPVRLVATDSSGGHEMDRLRRLFGEQDPYDIPARRMEVNRSHPIIRNLSTLASEAEGDEQQSEMVNVGIEQLYESALLMEGLHPNPASMVPRIQQLLEWATRG